MNKQLIIALSLSVFICGAQVYTPVEAKQYKGRVTWAMKMANKTLQTGKYKEAETRYTNILRKTPGNADARSKLSFTQAELYKLGAAEKNARQVLDKDPENGWALATLGIVSRNRTASSDMTYRRQRGKLLEDSVDYLKQALEQEPNSAEILTQLGITYRIQGDYTASEAVLKKAIELDSDYSEALVSLGISQNVNNNTDAAIETYKKAIRFNSKNYKAHYRLGEAYLKYGDVHKALETLNTALALKPDHAPVMTTMAEANMRQGNEAAAIANFQKAIHKHPEYMQAHTGLAKLYDNRGDEEMAMVTLKNAINLNPDMNGARNRLGQLALRVDKPEQAMQYFKETLKRDPYNETALNGMSNALLQTAHASSQNAHWSGRNSQFADAEAAVDEALRYNPNSLELHLAKLRINQLTGKPAQAQQELYNITKMSPHNDRERLIQAQAYFNLGQLNHSDMVVDQLIVNAQNRRDTEELLLLGDILAADRNLLMARKAYSAAGIHNKKSERAIHQLDNIKAEADKDFRLAQAIDRKGISGIFNSKEDKSALDFYESSLSQDPRQPEVRLEVAKLYEKLDSYDLAALSYQLYIDMSPELSIKKRERYQNKISKLRQK